MNLHLASRSFPASLSVKRMDNHFDILHRKHSRVDRTYENHFSISIMVRHVCRPRISHKSPLYSPYSFKNSPKAVNPASTCLLNCLMIFDLGAVPHAGLDICHRPPKTLGTVWEPSWKVSISCAPFTCGGSEDMMAGTGYCLRCRGDLDMGVLNVRSRTSKHDYQVLVLGRSCWTSL